MNNLPDLWQVEVNGQIYSANFDELVQWINEGAVIRQDMVRRGDLRWLEAGRVPTLIQFFNQQELNPPPPVIPTGGWPTTANDLPIAAGSHNVQNFSPAMFPPEPELPQIEEQHADTAQAPAQPVNPNACALHPAVQPDYVCEVCSHLFCSACPKTYGGTVRTCPDCGGLCHGIVQMRTEEEKKFHFKHEISAGFGFDDFGKALGYPMRYKTSLVTGGIMFMVLSLGQLATSFGGLYMMFGAIFCAMLANAFTFGILANTVNNFSLGLTDRNFMPSFDDFELWADVIHPFFLSIGVYIVSFGLFVLLIIGTAWYVANSFSRAAEQANPAAAGSKTEPVRQFPPDVFNDESQGSPHPGDEFAAGVDQNSQDEAAEMQRIQNMISDHRKNQLGSVVGKEPEMDSGPMLALAENLIKLALPFLVLAFITILWGFFYFPAACLVAGYSRSFVATINPLYGLDTIKRLGLDYVKILLMTFVLFVSAVIISIVLNIVLKPFNMPLIGNIPAIALVSFSTFYFSIIFSVILGYALYKNSQKFGFLGR